jgi:hypothetical protein
MKKPIFIAFGIIGLVAVGIGLMIYQADQPYRQAESLLRSEAAVITPPGMTLTQEKFEPGHCLDNCPQLVLTYRLATTTEAEVKASVAARLTAAGYRMDAAGGYGLKGHFQVNHVAYNAESATGTGPIDAVNLFLSYSATPR